MALTLIEAAKLETGDVIRSAIIELYAGSSDVLRVLPFEDIAGNALKYNREGNLPGVGFRGVNEAYTPSTGVLNPMTEPLVIAGGDLDVDNFIIRTMGEGIRARHEGMKVRALALAWTRKFIKGDQASDPREFDGLQTRIVGNQLIAAGATANGTPLSLGKLDEAIDQTLNPTHLIMNKSMARKLTVAARTTTVGGNISWDKDEFGRRIMMYNDLPIITVDLDGEGTAILPFTEAATSGTATATSIYVVSMGADGVTGIQNGGMDVRDLGELQTAPVWRTRVEWFTGIAAFNGRAATRLWSISDAAVTA
ncbi:MAG: major capsid protein [Hyphomicrobium sp.]|uniref:major capsid protein n=1 Tax=Hyphomicrobium sp. TaxID=82 RepID=UPI0035661055